jgi:hypothetical protein
VWPVTVLAVLLSPLAYEVSMRMFDFDLFASTWGLDQLFDWSLTSAHRSWIAGGVGVVFALLLPLIFRGLGHLYAAWILSVAGPEPVHASNEEATYGSGKFGFAMEKHESGPFQAERGVSSFAERIGDADLSVLRNRA